MSLCPGVTPKAHSLAGIGLRDREVVVIQEIEPKVRFLVLQGLYTFVEVALKLLSNPGLS